MNTRGKKNERGATAVEYGMILAGIALLAGLAFAMGAAFDALFLSQACNESMGYRCD